MWGRRNSESFDFGFGIVDCGLRPVGAIGAYAPEGMLNQRAAFGLSEL